MISRKYKYLSIFILLFAVTPKWTAAQDEGISRRLTTEQLVDYLSSIKNHSLRPAIYDESKKNVKCGFGIQAQVINRWKEFSQQQRTELTLLSKASVMQSDTIAGHFRFFYDTTGINEPALLDEENQRIPGTAKAYVNIAAQVFNHVWDVEVEEMGYSAPPFETGQSYYNVYIENVPLYGSTTMIWPQINGTDDPPKYQSYITIENDYQGFATSGINGLLVTAAHEFQHAIQIGSYGYRMDDYYAYELTSTWMEDVLYPDVNDYWNYLSTYFTYFSKGLSLNTSLYDGYERCIWSHYLAKKFGANIMLDIWKAMPSMTFLECNNAALVSRGYNLRSAFAEFSYWNYFTADRAHTELYYNEGNNYPRFMPLDITTFYNTTSTVRGDVQPLSSSMYEFDINGNPVTVIVSNLDIDAAKQHDTTLQTVRITLASGSVSQPYQELSNGLKIKVSVSIPLNWTYSLTEKITSGDAGPNPFRLSDTQRLLLPINEDQANIAEVYFYNSSLDFVYSGQSNVVNECGKRVIVIPASTIKSKLSSGVHFVVARTTAKSYKWKIAVIK